MKRTKEKRARQVAEEQRLREAKKQAAEENEEARRLAASRSMFDRERALRAERELKEKKAKQDARAREDGSRRPPRGRPRPDASVRPPLEASGRRARRAGAPRHSVITRHFARLSTRRESVALAQRAPSQNMSKNVEDPEEVRRRRLARLAATPPSADPAPPPVSSPRPPPSPGLGKEAVAAPAVGDEGPGRRVAAGRRARGVAGEAARVRRQAAAPLPQDGRDRRPQGRRVHLRGAAR